LFEKWRQLPENRPPDDVIDWNELDWNSAPFHFLSVSALLV